MKEEQPGQEREEAIAERRVGGPSCRPILVEWKLLQSKINEIVNCYIQYLYTLTISLDPFVDNTGDLRAVLLKVAKVTVTENTFISKLDPFSGNASLLQEVDDTMLVCDVRASATSECDILDLGDL
jgi:hypothetical protein